MKRRRRTVAVVVADELGGVDRVDPLAALLVGGRRPVDHRPGRPRVGGPAGSSGGRGMISNWWTDRGALAVRGAEAVGAGVAAADDDDVLALGGDRGGSERSPSWTRLAHGRYSMAWWMPSSSRPGMGRSRPAVAPPASTTASKSLAQLVGGDVDADVDAGAELGALGRHLLEAAVEVALLHLELGDAVAQQTADAVGALEHGDRVAGPGELLGGGETGGAGADDGDRLAGLDARA